jgi:hypothetical protein
MAAVTDIGQGATGSVRVLGQGWVEANLDDGTRFPVYRPPVADGTVTEAELHDGMSAAQLRLLAAYHEAGHAFAMHTLKVPVGEIQLYLDGDGLGTREMNGRPGAGHTLIAGPQTYTAELGTLAMVLVAGQVASALWLERCGELTEMRRVFTQKLAAGDHERLLAIDAEVAVAYLYGRDDAPADWQGTTIRVDHAEISVRGMLTAGWQLVERLAEIVAREGKADAETITRVFSGPIT